MQIINFRDDTAVKSSSAVPSVLPRPLGSPNALILKYHANKIMQVKSSFVPDNIKNEFTIRISFFCFDQNVFWAVAENKTFKFKREV